jgi:hypothetical protein
MTAFIKSKIAAIAADIRDDRLLGLILLANLVLHLWGIGWGLPNSASWAIDSVVPHKVLVAMLHGFNSIADTSTR